MFKLSNIRIGTKLAVISAMGILLVLAMIVGQMMGNAGVKAANDTANQQKEIEFNVSAVKSAGRGMQIGIRDLRLAQTPEDLKKALDYLADRHKSVFGYVDAALALAKSPENRERLGKIKSLADQYQAGGKNVAALKGDTFALRSKDGGTPSPETAARITELNQQATTIVRERTLPIATEMEALSRKNVGIRQAARARGAGRGRARHDHVGAHGLCHRRPRGAAAARVAVFGAVAIAKPLRALVPPLEEIKQGNFDVTVPGVGRKDEIGQIAAAADAVVQQVGSILANIKVTAKEVTNASAEISTSTTDLSQRTEEQAASLEETSASMEEITATVKKNAENAKQANQSRPRPARSPSAAARSSPRRSTPWRGSRSPRARSPTSSA